MGEAASVCQIGWKQQHWIESRQIFLKHCHDSEVYIEMQSVKSIQVTLEEDNPRAKSSSTGHRLTNV